MAGSGDIPNPGSDRSAEFESRRPLELSGRSRQLLVLLQDGKGAAGVLYEGGLRVLADAGNPARVRQAAYSLREMIGELEAAAGLVRADPNLKKRVQDLRDQVDKASRSRRGQELVFADLGGILEDFFAAFEADFPTRRGRAQTTIHGLDPAKRVGPPTVSDERTRALMDFQTRFNNILHGNYDVSVAEFQLQLERFESFLVDWLSPRTFADFDELDEFLAEGPPGG